MLRKTDAREAPKNTWKNWNAQSNEEVDKMLGELPFWGLVNWNVTPLIPFRSAIERDRKAAEAMKTSRR
jgi:hypothetical protein